MKKPLEELRRIDLKTASTPPPETDTSLKAQQVHQVKQTIRRNAQTTDPVEPTKQQSQEQPVAQEEDTNPQPQINSELLGSMIAQAVKNALADQTKQTQSLLEQQRQEEQDKLAQLEQEHQQQLSESEQRQAEAQQKIEAQLKEAQEALKAKEDALTNAQDIFKMNGYQNTQGAHFNTMVGTKSDTPEGALREFLEVQNSAEFDVRQSKMTGNRIVARDNREADRFARKNFHAICKDLETYGKANGLFRNDRAMTSKPGIPEGFLPTLSALMRANNRSMQIFWQFINYQFNFAKGRGDTIEIPRSPYLADITSSDDRLLSGAGVYSNIDSGNQSLQTGSVDCQVKEWGLGKNAANAPIGLPTFVQAYSMVDLMAVLRRNLLYDYYKWEDLRIRELYQPASTILYNNNNRATTTPGDVAANGGGMLTEQFANHLYAYALQRQIPRFPDGNYILACPPIPIANFKESLSANYEAPSEAALRELSEILLPEFDADENGRVTGYVGSYSGFHLFLSNAFGVGTPGSESVYTTTFGAGDFTTRDSYLLGADTTGRGIGSEFEIVESGVVPFGRAERYIWQSEEGFVAMDVDPVGYNDTSEVPQQTRVLKVRTTDAGV